MQVSAVSEDRNDNTKPKPRSVTIDLGTTEYRSWSGEPNLTAVVRDKVYPSYHVKGGYISQNAFHSRNASGRRIVRNSRTIDGVPLYLVEYVLYIRQPKIRRIVVLTEMFVESACMTDERVIGVFEPVMGKNYPIN